MVLTHEDMRGGIDFSKSRGARVKDNVNEIWRNVLSISKAGESKLIAFITLLLLCWLRLLADKGGICKRRSRHTMQ